VSGHGLSLKLILALLSALTALLCAPTAFAQPASPREIATGKALLAKHCARCHQIEAKGPSRLPIAPPFRDLMQRYGPEALEEALGEGLSSGHPNMPEFVFEPDEIEAILSYFGTLPGRTSKEKK
jgi:mono/diheme cytochrome c family protein